MSGPWDRPSQDREPSDAERAADREGPERARSSDEPWRSGDLWPDPRRDAASGWDDWSTLPAPNDFVTNEPIRTFSDPWAESWADEAAATPELEPPSAASVEVPSEAPPEPVDPWRGADPAPAPDREAPAEAEQEPWRPAEPWRDEPEAAAAPWREEPAEAAEPWREEPAETVAQWREEPAEAAETRAEPEEAAEPDVEDRPDERSWGAPASTGEIEPDAVRPDDTTSDAEAASEAEAPAPAEQERFDAIEPSVAWGRASEPAAPSIPDAPRVAPWTPTDDPWGAPAGAESDLESSDARPAPDAEEAAPAVDAGETLEAEERADVDEPSAPDDVVVADETAAEAEPASMSSRLEGWRRDFLPSWLSGRGAEEDQAAGEAAQHAKIAEIDSTEAVSEPVAGPVHDADASPEAPVRDDEPTPSTAWERDEADETVAATEGEAWPASDVVAPSLEPDTGAHEPEASDEVAESLVEADAEPESVAESEADVEGPEEVEEPSRADGEKTSTAEPDEELASDTEAELERESPSWMRDLRPWAVPGTAAEAAAEPEQVAEAEVEPPPREPESEAEADGAPTAEGPLAADRYAWLEPTPPREEAAAPPIGTPDAEPVASEWVDVEDGGWDADVADDEEQPAAAERETPAGWSSTEPPGSMATPELDDAEAAADAESPYRRGRFDRPPTTRPDWLPPQDDLAAGEVEERTRVLPTSWAPVTPDVDETIEPVDRSELAPHATPSRTRPAGDVAVELEEDAEPEASTAEQAVPWLIGFILLLAGMVIVLLALIFAGDGSLGGSSVSPAPSLVGAVTSASPTAAPSVAATPAASTAPVSATPAPSSAPVSATPQPGAAFGPLEMVYQGRAAALAPIYLLHREFTTESEPEVLAQDPNLDVRRFAWAGDGSHGAGLYADLLVSIEPGTEKRQLGDGISTITFNPDGTSVYGVRVTQSGSNDVAAVLRIDFASGDAAEVARITYARPQITAESALREGQFEDDGGAIRLYWMEDNQLRLWVLGAGLWEVDPTNGSVTEPERRLPVLWSPDGRNRIVLSEAGGTTTLTRLDMDGVERGSTTIQGLVSHLRWSPDSDRVVFTCGRSASGGGVLQNLYLWDLAADVEPTQITDTGAAFGAEWLGARVRWREDTGAS